MRRAVSWVILAGIGGCVPAPVPVGLPATASATKVAFPLVRPLDGGLLVTPVQVGSDWYLFELDPFAPRTRIDGDAVPHGEDDESARVRITAGGAVHEVDAELFDVRTIARDGFDLMGVLGRDVLRDDLVFGVDRDAGIAWLASPSEFHPPATIAPVSYLSTAGGAAVFGEIDGMRRYLAVDLGEPEVRLRRGPLADPEAGALLDREPTPAGQAPPADVQALGITRAAIPVADYHGYAAQGVLGAAFFAPFDLALDRARHLLYLAPRRHKQRTAARRVARWELPRCEHLGCAEVSVSADDGAAQPRLYVRRDLAASDFPLEVTLVAIGLPDAPRLRVGLPAHVRGLHVGIDARYAGHTLVVADANPYLRLCSGVGCLYVDEVAPTR